MKSHEVTRGQDRGTYTTYEPHEADESEIEYLDDWRVGEVGDFVLTDDGWVVFVLGSTSWGQDRLIRTPYGTFRNRSSDKCDTEPRTDRYSITGKSPHQRETYGQLTTRKKLFIDNYLRTGNLALAYQLVFGRHLSDKKANDRASILLNQGAVGHYMSEQLDDVMTELGVDERFIVERLKEEAMIADEAIENDDGDLIKLTSNAPGRLKAIEMLAKMKGVLKSGGGNPKLAAGTVNVYNGLSPEAVRKAEIEAAGAGLNPDMEVRQSQGETPSGAADSEEEEGVGDVA